MELRQYVVSDGHLYCVFVLALVYNIIGISIVNAGRIVSQNTTDDNKFYFLNELGIQITRHSPLRFEVKTCQDGILRFAETMQLDNNYYDVILGASANVWSGLRNRCEGCPMVVYSYGVVLDCTQYKEFWISWDGTGTMQVGSGSKVGEHHMLTYTDVSPFEIRYIAVSSYFGITGEWNFFIDEAPVFTAPIQNGGTVVAVSEDETVGKRILQLVASDPDDDVLSFTLVDDKDGQFRIDVPFLRIAKLLDFETVPIYHLQIRANDGHNYVTASLTVTVTDTCDEKPEVEIIHDMNIPEELDLGTVIGPIVAVTDKDRNASFTYKLTGADTTYLQVNTTTGQLIVRSRLDRDGTSARAFLDQMTLFVVDNCGLSVSVSINFTVLDINDNPPVFQRTLTYATVTEGAPSDTLVTTLSVTDADTDDLSTVSLTLIAGGGTVFTLVGNDLKVDGQLVDYEGEPSDHRYTLTVLAVDTPSRGQARNATCVIVVEVLPINEHAPVWTSPAAVNAIGNFPSQSISESVGVGTSVLTLGASDADLGNAGTLKYSIVSVRLDNGFVASSTFVVDSVSGLLRTSSSLDYDLQSGGTQYFDLEVQVTDNGDIPKESRAKLRLSLIDENDNPPVVSESGRVTITCSSNVGDIMTTVGFTDIDRIHSYTGKVIFSELDILTLNPNTGDLVLKAQITGDMPKRFTVVGQVIDGPFSVLFLREFEISGSCSSGSPTLSSSSATPVELQTSSGEDRPPIVKYVSEFNSAGLIEIWSLRATCALLAITLAVTVIVTLVMLNKRISTLTKAEQPPVSLSKVKRIAPAPSSNRTSSIRSQKTMGTSVESSDYFQ